jgi:2C-methyl-D-erythritol 2,4-cyclodiphosphate synthase
VIPESLRQYALTTTDSRVRVRENGRQAIFVNVERNVYYVVKVDGQVVKNALASDFVLTKKDVGNLVIELKGMDVSHAVEQVFATAQLWQDKGYRIGQVAALVVCSRKPSFDTKIQRFKANFAKKFKGPLHVVSRNDEFVFEKVLSFQGPK